MNSVAGDPASKMYAYDAGKRAIEDHFKRIGVKAKVCLLYTSRKRTIGIRNRIRCCRWL